MDVQETQVVVRWMKNTFKHTFLDIPQVVVGAVLIRTRGKGWCN